MFERCLMRHRASRHLPALLRLRRPQPRRRRGAWLPSRRGLRLAGALGAGVVISTGALVTAEQLDDDTVPHSDAEVGRDRLQTVPRTSRSSGRTPWPTATGAPQDQRGAHAGNDGPVGDRRPSVPAPETDGPRHEADTRSQTPQDEGTLPAPPGPSLRTGTPMAPSTDAAPELSRSPTPQRTSRSPTSASSPQSTPTATHTPADDTAPQTTLDSGPRAYDDSPFVFSANEPASFVCSLDGQAFRPCDSPHEYADLSPGWHHFAVRAADRAGNVDPSPATWRWLTTGLDTP